MKWQRFYQGSDVEQMVIYQKVSDSERDQMIEKLHEDRSKWQNNHILLLNNIRKENQDKLASMVGGELHDYILSKGPNYPISGGWGTSVEDAIVIHEDSGSRGVQLEYFILRHLAEREGCVYLRHEGMQMVLEQNDRHYDLQIAHFAKMEDGKEIRIEKEIYFDIENFFARP